MYLVVTCESGPKDKSHLSLSFGPSALKTQTETRCFPGPTRFSLGQLGIKQNSFECCGTFELRIHTSNDGNMTVYEQCNETHSGELNQVVQCVAEWAERSRQQNNQTFANNAGSQFADANEFRRWLLIICGALVFFMQTGFAMICAGCVRKKNMNNT